MSCRQGTPPRSSAFLAPCRLVAQKRDSSAISSGVAALRSAESTPVRRAAGQSKPTNSNCRDGGEQVGAECSALLRKAFAGRTILIDPADRIAPMGRRGGSRSPSEFDPAESTSVVLASSSCTSCPHCGNSTRRSNSLETARQGATPEGFPPEEQEEGNSESKTDQDRAKDRAEQPRRTWKRVLNSDFQPSADDSTPVCFAWARGRHSVVG